MKNLEIKELQSYKKYKFIQILQHDGEIFNNKPIYRIFNNKSGEQIGIIFYEPKWRKFVFTSMDHCIFDISCLENIIDFMKNEINK